MEKEYIKKYSDYWGNFNCSSNKNNPKTFLWAPINTNENFNYTIYVDNYIISHGNIDQSTEKIGWLLESPQMNENIINQILSNLDFYKKNYKYIFTCLENLLELGSPFTYTISNATPWILPENRKIHNKTKLVSMIASNKGWLRGHKERLSWVDKLKNKVDLFGTGRPFELNNKEDGLIDYMFSVAIENDYSDSYFTEKLTDTFATGTVPIYLGSKKVVERYFDPRGVIFLNDDPDLASLSENRYYDMMPYIEKNFELSLQIPIAEDYIYETYLKK
jgi:hypothetical protein